MKRGTFVVVTVAAITAAFLVTPALGGKGSHEKSAHAGCREASVKVNKEYDEHVAAFLEKYGERIKAVHEEYEGKKTEIAEEMEALKNEILAIAKADQPDLGKLESKLKKMSDLHLEMTKLRFRMHKEARKLIDDEADRAGFDRHFAMEMGCTDGAGVHAKWHWGHGVDKSMKGERSGCRAIFIGEKDGHAEVKLLKDDDLLEWVPGTLGEKRVEVFLDDDEDGARHVKVLVDGEDSDGETYEFMLDDEDLDDDAHRIIKKVRAAPGDLKRLKRDDRRIIKKMHGAPLGEFDDLIWTEHGGSAGPF